MKTIPQQVSVDHDSERYVREWLCAQAAGGFVGYDPDSARSSFRRAAETPFHLVYEARP